jgi:phenylalanine-4-hydroxylase
MTITKDNGGIIEVDHPSFTDKEYYQRRIDIGNASLNYKMSDSTIPIIDYNANENMVWGIVFEKLSEIYKTHACKEFNDSVREF